MKVNELPKDTNLTEIKVLLPKNVLVKYKAYCGGEPVMYIGGNIMGDFFLSPHHKDHINEEGKSYRRLYPMPLGVNPEDILEWEVVI